MSYFNKGLFIMKRKWLMCVLCCVLFLGMNTPVKASDWTFMVYLDGDNDLESYGIEDFLEMARVGSDSNVNIVVQFDRIPGYDCRFDNWSDCNRFVLTSGMKPSRGEAVADWGDGLGGREVDMADPQTLVDFAVWSMDNYPAERYALILWNHGGGWRAESNPRLPTVKAVCWDDTSGSDNALMMKDVKNALSGIKSRRESLDLIGFDACLMAMVEVAHEIRDCGSVMVGSEETEPGGGWPYDTILNDLAAEPSMTASDFGSAIVQRYGESYTFLDESTQAAIDLSQISALSDAVSSLADVMMEGNQAEIQAARAASQEYYYPENIDIGHFCELLSDAGDTDVAEAAGGLATALCDAVISECHNMMNPHSTGLAIYFPERERSFDADYNTDTLDFLADTLWGDFLENYYAGDCSGVTLISPEDGAVLAATSEATFSWQEGVNERYRIQFSPFQNFQSNRLTLTFPRNFWMPDTTTDAVPTEAWQKAWERINLMAQYHEVIYWRVLSRSTSSNTVEKSDVRSFSIEQ